MSEDESEDSESENAPSIPFDIPIDGDYETVDIPSDKDWDGFQSILRKMMKVPLKYMNFSYKYSTTSAAARRLTSAKHYEELQEYALKVCHDVSITTCDGCFNSAPCRSSLERSRSSQTSGFVSF